MTPVSFPSEALAGRPDTVVRLAGDLGSSRVAELAAAERRLSSAVRLRPAADLVVDLSRVESFGAGLLRVLCRARHGLADSGRTLTVVGDRLGVLRAAALDRTFALPVTCPRAACLSGAAASPLGLVVTGLAAPLLSSTDRLAGESSSVPRAAKARVAKKSRGRGKISPARPFSR